MNAPVNFDLAKAEPVEAPLTLSASDARNAPNAADYDLWFALAEDNRWKYMGVAAMLFVWACVIGVTVAIVAAAAPF